MDTNNTNKSGLRVDYETRSSVYISWDAVNGSDGYSVYAIDSLFARTPLTSVVGRSAQFSRGRLADIGCVGFVIAYLSGGRITGYSEALYCGDFALEDMRVRVLPSPVGGASVHFISGGCYDLYRVYSDAGALLAETEDCLLMRRPEGAFFVEAYMRDGKAPSGYAIKAASDIYTGEDPAAIIPDTPRLSVIIPVYNAGAFLARAMQSLIASEFTASEIIISDDGSDDAETLRIIGYYESNYSQVRAVRNNNKGVSAARNAGVDIATGDYIAFLDADDIVHPLTYKSLVESAEELGLDIAVARCVIRLPDGGKETVLDAPGCDGIVKPFRDVIAESGTASGIYFSAVWNKIAKADIARKVRFDESLRVYEDVGYTMALYSHANRMAIVGGAYYIWDKRKRATEGTLSTLYKAPSTEEIWRDYVRAYSYCLFVGNMLDDDVSRVCKLDVIKHLVGEYVSYKLDGATGRMFRGILKHIVAEYDVGEDILGELSPDIRRTLSDMLSGDDSPWDGVGPVPAEYYAGCADSK